MVNHRKKPISRTATLLIVGLMASTPTLVAEVPSAAAAGPHHAAKRCHPSKHRRCKRHDPKPSPTPTPTPANSNSQSNSSEERSTVNRLFADPSEPGLYGGGGGCKC
jgi:hypothetical protein